MEIKKVFENFFNRYKVDKTLSTRRGMYYSLNRFIFWCLKHGIEYIEDITIDTIEEYIDNLCKEFNLSKSAKKTDRIKLCTAFRILKNEGIIEQDIFPYDEKGRNRKLPACLDVEI